MAAKRLTVRKTEAELDEKVNGADVVVYGRTHNARHIAMLQAGRKLYGVRAEQALGAHDRRQLRRDLPGDAPQLCSDGSGR